MSSPFYDSVARAEAPQTQAGYADRDMFTNHSFSLPIHTNELGRVPFHHGFSPFLAPQQQSPQPLDIGGLPAGPGMLPRAGPLQNAPMDTDGFDVDSPVFSMGATDLQELLASLSAPSLPSAQQPQHPGQPQQANDAPYSASTSDDVDVTMISAENTAFADSMMEMWSTAPTSFE